MEEIVQLYRGYYKNNLLAVSIDKDILKEYLKTTRGLTKDEYDIQDSNMSSDDIYSLYSDKILVKISKDLYVTQGDYDLLENEVDREFMHYVEVLDNMREYYNVISSIDIMEKHAKQLLGTIHNMEEDLTTKKTLKKLRKSIIKKSDILSKDITEYLNNNKIEKENQELNRQYKYHLLYD